MSPESLPHDALARPELERPDDPPRSPDPFVAMPDPRRILVRFLIGLVAMVAILSLAGVVITSTEAFDEVRDWDSSISVDLAEDRTTSASDLTRFVTKIGDTLPVLALMAAVTVVLAAMRQWRAIVFIPMAMLAEITTFLSVSYLVGRERPAVEKIGPLPDTYSFPSGHVAATFVCWVGISVLLTAYGFVRSGRLVAAIGTLLAAAMAWARVYAGMHHTIDVLFGLAMGMGAVLLAVRVLEVDFRRAAIDNPP